MPKRHIDVFSDPEHSVGNVHLLLISPQECRLYIKLVRYKFQLTQIHHFLYSIRWSHKMSTLSWSDIFLVPSRDIHSLLKISEQIFLSLYSFNIIITVTILNMRNQECTIRKYNKHYKDQHMSTTIHCFVYT